MIANLIHLDQKLVSLTNLEKLIPDIYRHSQAELLSIPAPRIIKSHEFFDPRYPKVIYIVRDPRDVAISYYHYLIRVRKINESHPIEQFVPRFINGDFHSQFGTWGENVRSWLEARSDHDNFLLLKYESLLSDGIKHMREVASFIDASSDDKRLERVIELSSASRMRKLELKRNKEKCPPNKGDRRIDKPFIRAAKSGNWQTDLPEQAVSCIEDSWRPLMQRLGYLKEPCANKDQAI